MEIRGKSLLSSVVSKSRESEVTTANRNVTRKLKDSKGVKCDTPSRISTENGNSRSLSGKPGRSIAEPGADLDNSSQCNVKKESVKRTAEEIILCSDDSNDEESVVSPKKRKFILIDSDSSSE